MRLLVDDEAAQAVKRIYSMTLHGLGTEQIAAQLEKDGILTPRTYWLQKGVKRPGKGKQLRLQDGTARPSPKFYLCKNTAAIFSISRHTLNLIITRNGLIMTVKIGSFSKTYTSRSLTVPCGSSFSRNEERGADDAQMMAKKICFRVC